MPCSIPRSISRRLDPAEREAAAHHAFPHYLRGLECGAPERRTSSLFDPDWYRGTLSRGGAGGRRRAIPFASRALSCAMTGRPNSIRRPGFPKLLPEENPGLADAIGPEDSVTASLISWRMASREGRSPHPDLDLAWYAGRDEVRADIEAGRATDAFMHWITIGHPAGLPGRPAKDPLSPKPRPSTLSAAGRHDLAVILAVTSSISPMAPTRDQRDHGGARPSPKR